MKRLFALLLCIITMFSLIQPVSLAAETAGTKTFSAVSVLKTKAIEKPKKPSGLKITTNNKSKQLKISWKKVAGATGYQIYRSTTGKDGSYKKIATLKSKATSYTDKVLKSSKTYYYKVRSYKKSGKKTRYSDSAKINGSTKITNAFVVKKFNEAVKVCNEWVSFYCKYLDFETYITKKSNYGYDIEYYRVNHKTINTKKKLKKYLGNYFTSEICNPIINNEAYIEVNGKLYISTAAVGDGGYLSLGDTTGKITSLSDKRCSADITKNYRGYGAEGIANSIVERYTLVYKNGKWLFDQTDKWKRTLWLIG